MLESDRELFVQRFVEVSEFLNRQFYTGRLETIAGLDLTMPQIKTLSLLETRGPLRMSAIAIVMSRTLSAMTSIVDRLVEKGLVTRQSDPNDRRLVICALTDEGTQAIVQFWHIGKERLQMISDLMTDDQLHAAVTGLEGIRNAELEIQRTIAELLAAGRQGETRFSVVTFCYIATSC